MDATPDGNIVSRDVIKSFKNTKKDIEDRLGIHMHEEACAKLACNQTTTPLLV